MKGGIQMSKIDEYVKQRSARNPKFAAGFKQERTNFEAAVMIRNLRATLNLSQRQFAELVDKPQSTIARIESGSMNASIQLLTDIVEATGHHLTIGYEPAV